MGDYPFCMDNATAMLDIVAGKNSEVCIIYAVILPKLFEEDIEAGRQGHLFYAVGLYLIGKALLCFIR